MYMESKNQPQTPKNEAVSELRRDLVTGNWIVIAKSRGSRPSGPVRQDTEAEDPIETCPFEDPQASGNGEPVLFYKSESTLANPVKFVSLAAGRGADWTLQVIPNKYPAFAGGECAVARHVGPYSVEDGVGFHEVLITRDHSKHMALLPPERVLEVFRAYKERYFALSKERCVRYVSIFHNHGRAAGASLSHPHSQIIAIPISPSDARRSLSGATVFYRKRNACVHCVMLDWEREEKIRIVGQNKYFIAVCPFISRDAYEVRIFPQEHHAHFEHIPDEQMPFLAELFQDMLKRLYEKLENPPYNFYLHSAPSDQEYPQYHWHFEIHPKTEMKAGFELGTGVEMSTVEPERAARVLRG